MKKSPMKSPTPMKKSPPPMKSASSDSLSSPPRPKVLFSPSKTPPQTPKGSVKTGKKDKGTKKSPMKSSSGKKKPAPPRMARGTAGTFAGRRPPQDQKKLVLFELIKQTFNADREKDKAIHAETPRAKATPNDFWKYIVQTKKATNVKEFRDAYADWCQEMQ